MVLPHTSLSYFLPFSFVLFLLPPFFLTLSPLFSSGAPSFKKKHPATFLFICLCSVRGARGPPQNSLLWLFCLAQLQSSRGNTIMSQLHMVSEADKQNNLCFVCVLLMVVWEPRGAAGLGSSRRTDQRRNQAPRCPCPPPYTHTHTHTHTHTLQLLRAWWRQEDKDQTQRTSGGPQGRQCFGDGGGRGGREVIFMEVCTDSARLLGNNPHTPLWNIYCASFSLRGNWGQESTWLFKFFLIFIF